MKKFVLKIDVNTNWGVIPKGTEIVIVDDNTPLNQSYRCHTKDNPNVFGVLKTLFNSTVGVE